MEENKNVQLTDEQVDMIVEHLHPEVEEVIPVEELPTYDEIVEDIIDITEKPGAVKTEDSGLNLSDEDATALFALMNELDTTGTIADINKAPLQIKQLAFGLAMEGVEPKRQSGKSQIPYARIKEVTIDLIKFFGNQFKQDDAFKEFNEAIQNEMNFGSIFDVYVTTNQDEMETNLLEKAAKLEEMDKVEEAANLRALSATYTDCRKGDTLKDYIDNYVNKPQLDKKLNKMIAKPNKLFNEYFFQYEHSKFNPADILHAEKALSKWFTKEESQRYLALIMHYCRTKHVDVKDLLDHTFLYYSIENIMILANTEKETDWVLEMKASIDYIVEKLNTLGVSK